jgi:hypothetical protein
MVSFIYKSSESLLAAQKLLTGLARNLLDYCDEVPITLKPVIYECLTLILNRGEFDLNFMGFGKGYKELMSPSKSQTKAVDAANMKIDMKNVDQKLKVCLTYQTFLYQALQKVLEKLNQKGIPDKEREFVEQFTAIAYFRIPEFRNKLLENLIRKEDPIIDEWRGTEWGLDEEILEEQKNQQFVSLFDWENEFYVYLRVNNI